MKILKTYEYNSYHIPNLKSINVVIVGPDDIPDAQQVLFVPVWKGVDSHISVKLPLGRVPENRRGWDILKNNIDRLFKYALSGQLMKDIKIIKDSDKQTCINCRFTISGHQLNNELTALGL